jgi:copper chaperone NosL
MKSSFLFLMFALFLASCSIEPQEINYGKDACHACRMNIVDQQHASEIVTKKGKVFKYDSIECLVSDAENNIPENVAMYLVMDYNNPNTFLNATDATFLISENIPSPMGGYLSALDTKEKAEKMQSEKQGTLYSWNELQEQF